MTLQTLFDIVLGLAVIGWICWKQLTWRAVDIAGMLRMPLILGIIGVVMLAQLHTRVLTPVDLGLLAAELAVSAATGVAMGALARFRPTQRSAARPQTVRTSRLTGLLPQLPVVVDTRTGWTGVALWGVLIVVRIGMDAAAVGLGSPLVTATGVILIVIAANRAARVGVIAYRTARMPRPAPVRA